MGVIFGVVNIIVAVWFYSSAVSVQKKALMWAVIGALSFLFFKYLGYATIAMFQDSMDQATLEQLTDKGLVPTENAIEIIEKETAYEQSPIAGIFYEFFPLFLALLGVSLIRAKFILGMGYIKSLKHKTGLKLQTTDLLDGEPVVEQETDKLFGALSDWWKKRKKS
jgi:hypothetical protein